MKRRAAGEAGFQHKPVTTYPFDDSDVYKAIEGASFSLGANPDPALAARLEEMIAHVAAAQEPDGYLYTFRTMHPDSPAHGWIDQERWLKDPDLSHELYNLGHLYEAGVAHKQATGSDSLLDICLKSAELLQKDFGDGEPRIATGHQVIEMGLVKLYRQTGDKRWLDLCRFFLECRGGGSEYSQNHLPALEQKTAVGHAVRANYMYSGMADYAALSGDRRYLETITTIWENVVGRKLHITGGCGARGAGEAYGDDYELPHRCYNETCAAIAFLFWNQRMFLMTGDAKFMDVFERTLHNGFLSGVSLSGDRFFYPNTLAYDGREANNHGHAGRAPWFGCACCPPNLMRLLNSLGGYVCATAPEKLFVNLYAASETGAEVAGTKVKLTQKTEYPWDGKIRIEVRPDKPADFELLLRIPGWVRGEPLPSDLYTYQNADPAEWTATVNGEPAGGPLRNGYLAIRREWKSGDVVELDFPMPIRRVTGNPKIEATRGQTCLERGPVVFTFEGIDNGGEVSDLVLPDDAGVRAEWQPALMGGVTVLHVSGAQRRLPDKDGKLATQAVDLTAIPYAFWNNRGNSPMSVWLPRQPQDASLPPKPNLATKARIDVSFARSGMNKGAINDGRMPRNATDSFASAFDFWPHKGGSEWVTCSFDEPTEVAAVTVSWFDDTGRGECRVPRAWRLSYQDDAGNWQPVPGIAEFPVPVKLPATVKFPSIRTKALRIDIELQDGFASGIYEWEVHAPEEP